MMRLLVLILAWTGLGAGSVQLSPPNSSGVSMGHLHYRIRDVEADRKFWVDLGGEASEIGGEIVVRFPDVIVFLSEGDTPASTLGNVVNHVAFRVLSLDAIETRGFDIERTEQYPGVASVYTPSGERIELFDETATNLTFTAADGTRDPVAERHNRALRVPVIAHHIHLYVPEGSEADAQSWYSQAFGGISGMRWRYLAVDLPGINLNFSGTAEPSERTRGRTLDHIGFEVRDLEAFCRDLEARGVALDEPYAVRGPGLATAVLTDPWGTTIELTEGLERR